MPKISADIQVVCTARDGWTLYTSPELPGLYISSKDDKAAYEDLPLAIQTLIQVELGVSVSVSHKRSYEAFAQEIALGDRARREVASHIEELCSGQVIPFTITNSIRTHEQHQ